MISAASFEAQIENAETGQLTGFRNAIEVVWIDIVPARLEFLNCDPIGHIAIHLVRAHLNKRRLRTSLASRLKEIKSAHGVGVKIVKGNGRRPVMRRLSRSMNYHRRTQLAEKIEYVRTVANYQFIMCEDRKLAGKAKLVPTRIALGAEEDGSLIIV